MTPEKTKQRNQATPGLGEWPPPLKEVRNLDVWARSAPIKLAGYEDDMAESHILRSID
ncbi:hypothetical protein ABZ721_35440 [Streptomyces sp. NPDC006733]|uniref:Uncharacterized protein n=1 Tax=Streptomyces fildesensis TaxID=375757 RepID=A0ABW8C6H2_9ACTN|nr:MULTISPECIES: hypothetical protein [unclassified Streptomyces]MCM2417484.1 hypothetical protein [Streptomyces sp. RKAG293]MCM2430291.1 hypothetical protein [Streptomyces sp. RKAG337]